ncbi:uncharacterized protein TrAFT101_010509 [Trichoderma asperellum]|uniref:Uncharacterized protein n=1 Tax=Trichoderma asperellum (strain ATCC 204424 / CBS 433.97 / NBRC 101777) TaxID=1042311 RepID=A0A2T3YVT2_TRIA4|nr:hypothetical protein M441DRAFT_31204 [Trichoderma asperellum CBS 433.97]PTB36630.1 hypothetical protein M441DRAFT_31204 [Trichoderma asperellum CBS 433.97]UKZ95687.1 hypothetical protein TrAFT101_010509 [Trichoderma asperellum]
MRSATFATILGCAVYGSQAIILPQWPGNWPVNWFDNWFGRLDHFPENPCEWIGGTCDPIIAGTSFCTGVNEAPITGVPCAPSSLLSVGCCWHAPVIKKD